MQRCLSLGNLQISGILFVLWWKEEEEKGMPGYIVLLFFFLLKECPMAGFIFFGRFLLPNSGVHFKRVDCKISYPRMQHNTCTSNNYNL